MRVAAAAPDVVCGLEGEERDGDVCLDEGYRAGLLEEAYVDPVSGLRLPRVARVPDAGVEAADMDGVLYGDGDAGEGPGEVDFLFGPSLGFGEEDLGQAVCFGVGGGGSFAVGAEDGCGGRGFGLDIADELLDGLVEDLLLVGGEEFVVGRR